MTSRFLALFSFAAVLYPADPVRFVAKTKYLNNARAVVTHTIDDSTRYVVDCINTMDKYGIKATIFVSTEEQPATEDRFFTQLQVKELWPRLRQAIDNGHEIGSHSRQHPCKKPDDADFCSAAYTDYEINGSKDDILRLTQQPYVWSWCYPCGNCATHEFIQKRIAAAGYIVARNYPNEATLGHMKPDVQTWDDNPMNASYTQAVQHLGTAKSDPVNLAAWNAKFDEVYQKGGIYNFMSHPQWLDYGPEAFYEQHLRHVTSRRDIWYVPMGPLYAYRTLSQHVQVRQDGNRFILSHDLDPKVYSGSLTLEFANASGTAVLANGHRLEEHPEVTVDRWNQEFVRRDGNRLFVTVHGNTTLEFVTAPPAANPITGLWKIASKMPNGLLREATLDLKVNGGKLSGTLRSDRGVAPITSGEVRGNEISFTILRKGNNDEISVRYSGSLDGDRLYLKMFFGDRQPVEVLGSRAR